jgi:hypothetical protein
MGPTGNPGAPGPKSVPWSWSADADFNVTCDGPAISIRNFTGQVLPSFNGNGTYQATADVTVMSHSAGMEGFLSGFVIDPSVDGWTIGERSWGDMSGQGNIGGGSVVGRWDKSFTVVKSIIDGSTQLYDLQFWCSTNTGGNTYSSTHIVVQVHLSMLGWTVQ